MRAWAPLGIPISFLPNTASAKAGLHLRIPNLVDTAGDIIKTLGATEACSFVILLAAGMMLFVTRDEGSQEGAEEEGKFFILRPCVLGLRWGFRSHSCRTPRPRKPDSISAFRTS